MSGDEFEKLMAELRAWAAQAKHGEQKALANQLGVSPQRLNHWITGRNVPNLKDGLKLQAFLKAQQRRRPRKQITADNV
jgi:DNA-binding XRE family transcriptional regulator